MSEVGDDPVVAALVDLGAGHRAAAEWHLAASDDPLAGALLDGLHRGDGEVYVDPEAFTRFIDGGANPALYEATIAALAVRPDDGVSTLLDIGCGDGRVSAAVLDDGTTIDLLEPSGAMLATAVEAVSAGRGRLGSASENDLSSLLDAVAPERRWDRAQATFALHNLAPAERAAALSALRPHVGELCLVEFDVPAFADRSVEHAAYCADAYRRGLEQHPDNVVIRGFLVPVLLGQFEPGAPRHTHEQPIEAWAEELSACGYADVRLEPVFDGFWWAMAHLVRANGGG